MGFVSSEGNRKIDYPKIIFGFLFTAIVAAGLYFVINPSERKKEARDKEFAGYMSTIVQTTGNYFNFAGRFPWTDDLGSSSPTPPLPWTLVKQPEVGICGDGTCSKAAELTQEYEVGVPGSKKTVKKIFLGKDFLKTFISSGAGGELYIGKGSNPQDKVYVCFLPSSEKIRQSLGSLYKVTPGSPLPYSGVPDNCSSSTTWKEDDVCFSCASN